MPLRPAPVFPNPDGTLPSGARICAAQGFGYVVQTGPREVHCLQTNPDNEPEAVAVEDVLKVR